MDAGEVTLKQGERVKLCFPYPERVPDFDWEWADDMDNEGVFKIKSRSRTSTKLEGWADRMFVLIGDADELPAEGFFSIDYTFRGTPIMSNFANDPFKVTVLE